MIIIIITRCCHCDLNVPLNSDLQITDETRITASVPTIKHLCDKRVKVIACSHLGRPKQGPEEKCSLKPVAKFCRSQMRPESQHQSQPSSTFVTRVPRSLPALTFGRPKAGPVEKFSLKPVAKTFRSQMRPES